MGDPLLLDEHIGMLVASCLTAAQIDARGYESVTDLARLAEIGIARAGRNVPGLLIPLRRADGSVWGYQYRPDEPRTTDAGRAVKYETPAGQRNGLDVPPGVGPMLGDPDVPLLLTEGSKKADSAAVHGLACVSVSGVWSWRGRNPRGGKVAVADWEDVALDGRRVVLAFDSDVTIKAQVRRALDRLAAYLASKGGKIEYAHLPDLGDGKCGLDDYLRAHGAGDVWSLVRPEPPAPAGAETASGTDGDEDDEWGDGPPEYDGDPAALLDEVHRYITSYVVFGGEHAAVAVTLWAVHTHLVRRCESTPRLALLSPEPGCGKTRALEVLGLLCVAAEHMSDSTAAYIYRRVGAGRVTILLDEADTIWRRGTVSEAAEALRSVVNAGHRRGATVGRVETVGAKHVPKRFPCYAPAAIAYKGRELPDTIMDRSVVVRMRRRAPGEAVSEFRARVARPAGEALRAEVARWAASVAGRVGDPWPEMPDGVSDRPADVWEPLLMVADLAGGEWPERAREACVGLLAAARSDADTGSLGLRLLGDVREIFRVAGDPPAVSSEGLLARLRQIDESPWSSWGGVSLDARGLARLLGQYDVHPVTVRMGKRTPRGYRRADLADVWSRYLPDVADVADRPKQAETGLTSDVADVADVAQPREATDELDESDERDPFAGGT